MSSKTDIAGKVFDRLTAVERVPGYTNRDMWACKCACGKESVAYGYDLRNGKTRSCGCIRSELMTTHGMHKTRFYRVWHNMIERCRNENSPNFAYYGGRGISVCDKWKKFEGFKEDLYEEYIKHSNEHGETDTTLDRTDVNCNYELNNVKWATMKDQSKNKRINKNNSSGYPGVGFVKNRQKWRARISLDWKEYHVGMFDTLEEAVIAREIKLKQLEGER